MIDTTKPITGISVNGTSMQIEGNLGTKTITQDGTYTAQADGYDGFSSVTVSTGGGGGGGASFASYISVKAVGSEIFAYAYDMTSAQAQAFMTGTTTSHWEVASRMFFGCRTMVVAPSFDTSNLIDIADIFQNCTNLTTLPAYDFSKASNFAGALAGTAITSVPDWQFGSPSVFNEDLQDYEPLPATGDRLFSYCTHLASAYFNQDTWFDTAEGMFQSCTSLEEVGDFNTTACMNMNYMFYGCTSLRVVGSLDFNSCEYCYNMFSGCISLEEIHIYGIKVDFDISDSTEFSAQALEDIIYDCLEDLAMEGGSATLYMGQTNLAKLSQNAIDDANMKGWTLA